MAGIKKDDQVMVIAGKDRGHVGRVVSVLPKKGKVQVEGAARSKRHTRPTRQNQQGGIIDKEQFIDISNVQIVCKSCGRPTRIGFQIEGEVKVRICRRCGAEL
ncbi:MAG: 50S ribosomal protein L24 [Actinomycetota bacterium]